MRARVAVQIPDPGAGTDAAEKLARELHDTDWGHHSPLLSSPQLTSLLRFAENEAAGEGMQSWTPSGSEVQRVLHAYMADEANAVAGLRTVLTIGDYPKARKVAAQSISVYLSSPREIEYSDEIYPIWNQRDEWTAYGLCYRRGQRLWVDLVVLGGDSSRLCRAVEALLSEITEIRGDNRRLKKLPMTYDPVELREGEVLVARGEVVGRRGKAALTREIMASGSGGLYYSVGIAFGGGSWALSVWPSIATWVWLGGLFGNLAAGFVAAGLIDSAVRFNRAVGDDSLGDRKDRLGGKAIVRWSLGSAES